MKTPRAHQQQAIDSIDTSLDRQQIIMACGTGKTLVGMHVAQKFIAGHDSATVVVTVPTLGLLEQTYRAWREDAPFSFDAIAICSQDIGGINNEDISLDELSMTTTTNAGELAEFLSSTSGVRVIFSTYQSSPVLGDSQRTFDVPFFDVAIVDEAHRTAGDSKSAFTSILTDTSIRVTKRVFMTATPKVVSSKSDDISRVIMSMDDESVYGERRYELSVRDAVNAGLLSDFKLLVVGVTDREVDQYFEQYGEAAENIAAAAALNRAIDDYGLSSSLVYFNTIVASDAFARTMQRVAGAGVECYHVDGTIPLADRLDVLDKIECTSNTTVISNSRCLSEGIDVPTLDSVMFADARNSDVDIVQCIGRAIRKNPHGDKEAKIILNVRVHENEDVEQIIDSGEFKKIRQIISGLESHDSELASVLRNFPRGENRERDYLDNWIEYRLPEGIEGEVFENFKSRFIISTIGINWEEEQLWMDNFTLTKEFAIKFDRLPRKRDEYKRVKIGKWVDNQKTYFKRGKLSKEQIKLIESIPNWYFPISKKDKFVNNCNLVEDFVIKFDRLPKYYEEYKGVKIGDWVNKQFQFYNNGTMSEDRISLMESIPQWDWKNVTRQRWMDNFTLTKEFAIKFDRLPKYQEEYKGVKIGFWTNRYSNRTDLLSEEEKQLLETIPHWRWSRTEEQRWMDNFTLTKEFAIKFDRLPKVRELFKEVKLGTWVKRQRKSNSSGTLSEERKLLLESIPHWYW